MKHEQHTSSTDFATRLKQAFAPVEPRPAFVASLKQSLAREARALRQTAPPQPTRWWVWLAVGIGGLVYAAGVMAVSVRGAMWVLSAAGFLLGLRKRNEFAKTPNSAR